MLLSIRVKNFALIDEVEINPGKGLNVITGETGAGKSIVIDAVNFALGKKTPKDVVRDNAEYALSELVFSAGEKALEKLQEFEIPCDNDEIIITRKIVNGRSSQRINGESVTCSKLLELSGLLIDIHGQHEHQSLLNKNKHIDILDSFLDDKFLENKKKLAALYRDFLQAQKELKDATGEDDKRERDLEFAKFEVKEIKDAHLILGEDDELEIRYYKMLNSKKISESVSKAYKITGYDGDGAGALIGRAVYELKNVSDTDNEALELYNSILEIDSILNDFNRSISSYEAGLSFSEEDFYETENRLNLINNLKAKYGKTIEAVLDYANEREKDIEKYSDYDNYIAKLESKRDELKADYLKLSKKISDARKKEAESLSKDIKNALVDLNFLDSAFLISVSSNEEKMTEKGIDEVEMLISTNPGEKLKSLSEVASGGEMSRIMLAIKSTMAGRDNIGTLIFDEIDTGISGRTAQKVSEKMCFISKEHQLLCVTHLPQIAAMADSHFEISKSVDNERTVTDVKLLSKDAEIKELARMLGGMEITDTVIKNAGEMKDMANNYKKEKSL